MNKTTGYVLRPRKYTGPTAPPLVVEDTSRYNIGAHQDMAFGAGAAAPNWSMLPSGRQVLEYDGGDYALCTFDRWRDWDSQGTILGWVNTTYTAGDQTIFATADTGGVTNFLQLRIVNTSGFLEILQRDGGPLNQITGDVACNDGIWHHCVVTGDTVAGAYILYVDGVVQVLTVTAGGNTGNWFDAMFDIRDAFSVGALVDAGLSDYIYGLAPPPDVLNYVLTHAQVQDIFNKERGQFAR